MDFLYHDEMIRRSRKSFMNNLLVNNVALCVGRQGNVTGSDIYDIIYMSENIVDLNITFVEVAN